MTKHKMLTNKQFQKFAKEFKALSNMYLKCCNTSEIDWKKYEKEYASRVRYVGRELNTLTEEAISFIKTENSSLGRPQKLQLKQKVITLLLKSIFEKHNRPMAGLLSLFGTFTGTDISYKTIERLYSDETIQMVLHNMFILMIKQKCSRIVDVCGDGTGYTLTVTKHYRTEMDKDGYRKFVYSFNVMDIKTKLYVACGSGIRSEKEAFENAMKQLKIICKEAGIQIRSARLDKYYSYQSTLKYFDDKTILYIIPKSNTKVNGKRRWRDIFKRMMENPLQYLIDYYKRENSESGFSVDKRMTGWKIWQKRNDRIYTAINCIATIHNLFRMGYE